jgi:hypothetical protein
MSKGIQTGTSVKYGGVTPLAMDSAVYAAGWQPKGQSEYWASVNNYTKTVNCHLMSTSVPPAEAGPQLDQIRSQIPEEPQAYAEAAPGGDNLVGALDALAGGFEELLRKVERVDNQVGLALITHEGVQTIEAFDVPASWEAIHSDCVQRLGAALVNKDEEAVFDYKPERAVKAVTAILARDWKTSTIWEHRKANGDPAIRILGLSADGYSGEVVELEKKAIHLVIVKTK